MRFKREPIRIHWSVHTAIAAGLAMWIVGIVGAFA